jgi:hypothetical protein
MEFVNETYQVETGDSGIGFKCVNRLTSRFVTQTDVKSKYCIHPKNIPMMTSGLKVTWSLFKKPTGQGENPPYIWISKFTISK